ILTIMRIVVVFPLPLGPMKPKTLPSGTLRERSSTAVTSPKVLVTLEISTAGIGSRVAYGSAFGIYTRRESRPCFARMQKAEPYATCLRDVCAARPDIHRVQRLAGRHVQPVALGTAEAEVGADLRQQDHADAFPLRRKHVYAIDRKS